MRIALIDKIVVICVYSELIEVSDTYTGKLTPKTIPIGRNQITAIQRPA